MKLKQKFTKGMLQRLSVFLVLPMLPFVSSCSSNDPLDFKSDDAALNVYLSYLNDVKTISTTNTDDFCRQIQKFKATTDTVYRYLRKDSVFLKDPLKVARFKSIHDSLRFEMVRLTETWRYSYSDVLSIKEKTSSFHDDKELSEAVHQATPFFISLDSIPVIEEDKAVILARYRNFLKNVKDQGVHSREDMLTFIRREDIIFRSFLSHLYELDNEPISDITENTEQICNGIFVPAREGNIPARDVMIYMSKRTVRRLLQNSAVCVADINKQQMKSKAQGNAYLWMIIQPFISIDQFAIATLTPQERSNFNYVIRQLPKSIQFAKTFDIDQRSLSYLLPQQLLKIYVLSL